MAELLDHCETFAFDSLDSNKKAGSMIARASSGSRSCSISVDPFMSANSAVTVLRSPSIFSLAGVSATRIGESLDFFAEAAEAPPSAAPQSSQNLAVAEFSAPHFEHRFDSGPPHSGQNFLPDVLSVPHLEQCMSVAQFVQQRLGVPEVGGIEALGEQLFHPSCPAETDLGSIQQRAQPGIFG
jgi:hypothetical protein